MILFSGDGSLDSKEFTMLLDKAGVKLSKTQYAKVHLNSLSAVLMLNK